MRTRRRKVETIQAHTYVTFTRACFHFLLARVFASAQHFCWRHCRSWHAALRYFPRFSFVGTDLHASRTSVQGSFIFPAHRIRSLNRQHPSSVSCLPRLSSRAHELNCPLHRRKDAGLQAVEGWIRGKFWSSI